MKLAVYQPKFQIREIGNKSNAKLRSVRRNRAARNDKIGTEGIYMQPDDLDRGEVTVVSGNDKES